MPEKCFANRQQPCAERQLSATERKSKFLPFLKPPGVSTGRRLQHSLSRRHR